MQNGNAEGNKISFIPMFYLLDEIANIGIFILGGTKHENMLACFGSRSYGPIESDLEKMDVSVLVNKTERMLVVPRNCFYLVTLQGASHMVAPVCPKGAILLMPQKMGRAGMTAVVSEPNVIEEMNIWALCSELEFNSAFVAANRRIELESLRHELTSRHDTCSSIV